jgi:hypothetical protein
LPATVTNLTIRNQAMLTGDGLVLAGINNIETLVLENMNSIDQPALIRSLLARSLTYVRLTGLDVADDNLNMFFSLAQLQGVDENGMNTAHAIVTGAVNVTGQAYASEVADLQLAFPELVVTGNIIDDPVTTFVFTSTQSETITNGVFLCNGSFTKINEYTYEVAAPVGFAIKLSFTAQNHETRIVSSYVVTGTRIQIYTVTYRPLRTITFTKYSDSSAAAGVVATINGQEYISDSSGRIYVRSSQALTGQALLADYGMAPVSYPASAKDSSHSAVIKPFVDDTISVV